MPFDLADARRRDAENPLRQLRDRFLRADSELIYLDGNSLGMLPVATAERLAQVVRNEWGGELVRGWQHWADLPTGVGDRLGAALLGAAAGQVVVCDTTSANLHKTAAAALAYQSTRDPGRHVVVTDDRNFPTDRFVLAAVAAQGGGELRVVEADPVAGVTSLALQTALAPGDVAVVSICLVDYRSAALQDLAAVTRQVQDAGALMLWDLAHAVGAVPIALDVAGVDLAVGCTYKHVNAGPGAPAFLYVRHDLADRLISPVPGWWGADDLFDMDADYRPAVGAARFQAGSPNVLGLYAVDEGVRLHAEAGIDTVRAVSIGLLDYLVALAEDLLAPLGFSLASPQESARRGGHVVLRHPDAYRIGVAAVERGVVGDVRPPDLLRLAPVALTTSYEDVFTGLTRIRDLVVAGEHTTVPARRSRIT